MRRRVAIPRERESLSEGSSEEFLEFEDEDLEDDETREIGSHEDCIGLKWEFRDQTWNNSNFLYDPLLEAFSGNPRGPTFTYKLPHTTSHATFNLIWTIHIILDYVCKTSRDLLMVKNINLLVFC